MILIIIHFYRLREVLTYAEYNGLRPLASISRQVVDLPCLRAADTVIIPNPAPVYQTGIIRRMTADRRQHALPRESCASE